MLDSGLERHCALSSSQKAATLFMIFSLLHDSCISWGAVQAKDLECYLERMWHISLPGFSSRCVTAVPKIGAESAHMKNRASVRSYLAQLPVQQPSEGEKNDESAAATVG